MNKSEQINALIAYFSGGSKTAFAAKLGLKPQSISNWIARNTLDADLIYSKCENVSAEWLLTGKGNMLNTDAREASFSEQSHGVPFYDVDFCGGFDMMVNDQSAVPTGYIDFPQYNRADSWARITGHSMEPLISNGDIIALRKVEDWQSYLLYVARARLRPLRRRLHQRYHCSPGHQPHGLRRRGRQRHGQLPRPKEL